MSDLLGWRTDRYQAKRDAGISPVRYDGSLCSPETDAHSEAAEQFAANRLGARFNGSVYDSNGDGGHDFLIGDKTVEVVWLGFRKGTTIPRYDGHLIVNPEERHRWADLYVVVAGSIGRGFTILGWAHHHELREGRDFGYGPKLSLPTACLHGFARTLDRKVAE